MIKPDEKRRAEFKRKLTALLNEEGVDSEMHIPDFILAECVINNLDAIQKMRGTCKEVGFKTGW